MAKMQRTNLAWDKYIDYLIDVINGSKFMKRAENKPMATPKTETESHISTRSIHLRESADVAKRLAKGLGLNENYIYAAMLMHDAGHPFSAHEGEEIFNYLGDIYNTQYFHHNAKGVEIILSEDICGKAISKIPNIDNNPELRKQLEDEFNYFLDVVISHDGEATREDMMKSETYYETISKALQEKIKLANSENKYKFIAQTPEGKIAKFADVIAYLTSDMQDGFRLGIIKGFSDDYLEMFGEMFSTEKLSKREEKIEYGRKFVDKIKEENLREKREIIDSLSSHDDDMQHILKSIIKKVYQSRLDIHNKSDVKKIQEIVKQEQENFRKKKTDEIFNKRGINISEKEKKRLERIIMKKQKKGVPLEQIEKEFTEISKEVNSKVNKIEEFTTKTLRVRSNVVYEVTSKIKEFFINDLIEESKDKETPQFSEKTWDMFFKAKKLDYKEYVQYTNWNYQTQELPKAAKSLVEMCATSLIKSGAIRNKFYEEEVRKHVKKEDALAFMETQYKPERQYTSYRRRYNIGDLKTFTRPSKSKYIGKRQYERMKLFSDIYSYVQNENEVFAMRYENTFSAIKSRIVGKTDIALSKQHQVDEKHLYREDVQKQVNEYRREIIDRYKTTELTEEQRDEFINEKVQLELERMDEKMAKQLATDYLAGMTDRCFINIAIKTGYLSPNIMKKATRGTIPSASVGNIMNKMDKEEKQISTTLQQKGGEER